MASVSSTVNSWSENLNPPQLVRDLGLQDHYPHKLSLTSMREVSWDKLDDSKPTQPEDLPWRFLQMILSANSLARNPEWPPAQSSKDNKADVEDFIHFLQAQRPRDSGINPLDIIAAIFLCADHSLQQELMLKMSLCQLALPFLLPEGHSYPRDKMRGPMEGPGATLLLWAMRPIVKMWCPQSPTGNSPVVEMPIVTATVPTVSFLRLGRCTVSKSKLLNLTLSQTQLQQNIFLHSGMECGNVPRGISDGMAEISWYLPSGKSNTDIFPEAAAFINLRGDAETYQGHTRFLAKVSAALFIFIDVIGEKEREFLTSLAQSPAKLFLIVNTHISEQHITPEQVKKLFKDLKIQPQQCIVRTNVNKAELVEGLHSQIKQVILMSDRKESFPSLEQTGDVARENGIPEDELHPEIEQAKNMMSKPQRKGMAGDPPAGNNFVNLQPQQCVSRTNVREATLVEKLNSPIQQVTWMRDRDQSFPSLDQKGDIARESEIHVDDHHPEIEQAKDLTSKPQRVADPGDSRESEDPSHRHSPGLPQGMIGVPPAGNNQNENRGPLQLMKDLGLQDHYPHKLSMTSMREVSWDKLDDSKPTQPEVLPWRFLQMILSANSLARNPEWPPAQSSKDNKADVEDFIHFLQAQRPRDSGINPLDIIAAIFLCADHSLQQELMLKMSLCQLALPFLLPEGHSYPRDKVRGPMEGPGATLLLWAMRPIVKMWCPQSPTGSSPVVEMPIVTATVPTVSFLRLGRCTVSKSKLLNLTLSQTQLQQNIFLHSGMKCGNVPRRISDGMAEISWYLPSGKSNTDIFPEAAAFINLRGDAETYQGHTRFLAKVSAALFIFIDVIGEKEREFLTSLAQSPAKLFLIVNTHISEQHITPEQVKKLFKDLKIQPQQCIVRTNVNKAELVVGLHSQIKQVILMSDRKESFPSLEQTGDVARENGIPEDELHPEIEQAKNMMSKPQRKVDPGDSRESEDPSHWHSPGLPQGMAGDPPAGNNFVNLQPQQCVSRTNVSVATLVEKLNSPIQQVTWMRDRDQSFPSLDQKGDIARESEIHVDDHHPEIEQAKDLMSKPQRVADPGDSRESEDPSHRHSPSLSQGMIGVPPAGNNQDENRGPLQLMKDLGLQDHYPHKLSLTSMREVSWDKLDDSKPTQPEDLPWRFLQKILSANSLARNPEWPPDQSSKDNEEDIEDFSYFFQAQGPGDSRINPLDIIAAIFLCANYSLQQELMMKMSLCQLALPFLLPEGHSRFRDKVRGPMEGPGATLLLWAMRPIVKMWCPHPPTGSSRVVEMPIVTANVPTVSFLRLGRCTVSKSRILNLTLSQTQLQQNIFLHSGMKCGNVPREISDGMAEISWYLPSGKNITNIFPEAATFINLRGDAETYQGHTRFLAKVSAALFIFIDVIGEKEREFLTSLAQSPAKLFLIVNTHISEQHISPEQVKKLFVDLKLKPQQCIVRTNVNEAELVEKLRSQVNQVILMSDRDQIFLSLEQMGDIARESGIQVDEHQPEIQRAKDLTKILGSLDPADIIRYKKRVLPFHGEPWQGLSKVEKEKSRMKLRGNRTTEKYNHELDQDKKRIREAQLRQSLSGEMQMFIDHLTCPGGDDRAIYLQWLKLMLDSKSRQIMAGLRRDYKKLSKHSKQKVKELKDMDQKMTASSLGLEHFMRELGQVYEFSMTQHNIKQQTQIHPHVLQLPGVAAGLLLDGFPLELIDGDVSNVPVSWITAVLEAVAEKVGRASRVFVLTVIGVQSTGKSTLLNTMFCLRFAVSSGRCTRGAYMQLMKVTGSLAEELGCDFILVIDTEGLRAPELATLTDSYEHDNELATFVVGLSNITLVNIGMENIAEMKDILQIVIHSLLRMKLMGKRPKCIFIHQNVGDVSAHDHNLRGRQKLLEQLDKMTEAAAKLEKVEGVTFRDVMDYDADKDNWYIPGLWQGTPPMAAVNTGYSEHVFQLKKSLIQCLLKGKLEQGAFTILDFTKWMTGLWEQVKHENFIFSFQNSLFAEAYNQLSVKYKDWEWELRKFTHSWGNEAENTVNNASGDLNLLLQTLEREIRTEINKREGETLDKLKALFESGADNVQLMEKYREEFKLSISSLCRRLQDDSIHRCKDAVNRRVGLQEVDDSWNQCHKKIEQQVKELLLKCKGVNQVLGDEELQPAFGKMWQGTVSQLDYQPCRERNIELEIENLLRENTATQGRVINEMLDRKPLCKQGTQCFQIEGKHINTTWTRRVKPTIGISSHQSDVNRAAMITQSLEDQCHQWISDITKMYMDYDNRYCIDLLNIIQENINNISHPNFTMSEEFRAEFKLHLCGFAVPRFQEMQMRFIQKHDPRQRLENMKGQYFDLFIDIYTEQDENQRQAERFAQSCFLPALRDATLKALSVKIVDDMKQNDPESKYSLRNNFTVALLVHLKQRGTFHDYHRYITDLENLAKDWLHRQVIEHCKTQRDGKSTFTRLAKGILTQITGKAKEIVEDAVTQNFAGNVQSFLDMFVEKLKTRISMPKDEMKLVMFHSDGDGKKWAEAVLSSIEEVEQRLLSDVTGWDVQAKIEELSIKPRDELFKGLFNCTKKCPFCGVFCVSETPVHSQHSCKQHRPNGLNSYRFIESEHLVTAVCTASVAGNGSFKNNDTNWEYKPYKDYQTVNDYYKSWTIQQEISAQAASYWKKVFYTFNEQFAEKYKAKPAEIDEAWDIDWDVVRGDLNKTYNTNIQFW
ncbi:interferon-induced very large GTPase 1-like [Amblyraja radiata]|uniref:interferon-induced very large GTPase 1-like n=1 Tax=Amblyraja radiata TaxID=386614 RepID=UPI001401F7D3|nr:interferon-induced very large GTPase 1-like [Amblyraja radiata]